jgi:hypothetical protein
VKLGNMNKINELSRVKTNELFRIIAMMVGDRHGLFVTIEKSKIAQVIEPGEYAVMIDLDKLIEAGEPKDEDGSHFLNLKLRVEQKNMKKLRAFGKAGSKTINIFTEADGDMYLFMNGTKALHIQKTDVSMPPGPIAQEHESEGVPVTVAFEDIEYSIVPGKRLRLDLFRNKEEGFQLERIQAIGREPQILKKPNLKKYHGKMPDKYFILNNFPYFATSGNVTFQIVKVAGAHWLKCEWDSNIAGTAFTLNRLY